MRVSLYPSFNQNKKQINKDKFPQKIYLVAPIPIKKISFGSADGIYWIYRIAKEGISVIKDGPKAYKLSNLLSEMRNIVKNPHLYNNETLANTLSALSKIPDSATEGGSFTIFASLFGKMNPLDGQWDDIHPKWMRPNALPIVSMVKDDAYVNIQSKKDFMNSVLNEGHLLCPPYSNFIDPFSRLNDNHYNSFKHEVIDKVLYSREYADKLRKRYDDQKL